jgi:hypothetical protein
MSHSDSVSLFDLGAHVKCGEKLLRIAFLWNISYAPAADITFDFFSSFENRMRVFTWHVWLLQGPLEVSITSLLEQIAV